MSLSALIYSSLAANTLRDLTEKDMFQILQKGNNYYERNMEEILMFHPNYFRRPDNSRDLFTGIDDIHLKNVTIFGQKIAIKTGETLIGNDHREGMASVKETLRDFLQSEHPNRAGIVICGPSSRAIMKKSENDGTVKYYLFDSHAFNSQRAFRTGKTMDGDNNAAFVEFEEVEQLISTFKNLISELPANTQLDVTEILCEKVQENNGDISSIDIDNYNPGTDGNLEEMLRKKFDQENNHSNGNFFSICIKQHIYNKFYSAKQLPGRQQKDSIPSKRKLSSSPQNHTKINKETDAKQAQKQLRRRTR